MINIFKITKFEFNRIFKSKANVTYLCLMILLFSLTVYAYKNVIILPNTTCNSESTQAYYIEQRNYYKVLYEFTYGINSDVPEGFIFPPNLEINKDIYYMEYLKFNHYVSTSTSSCDYVNQNYPLDSSKGLEGGVFLIILGNISFYIIGFLCIILSLSINFYDYSNGNIKNLLQAKIDRNSIFKGKLLFTFIAIVTIILLYDIIVLLISSTFPPTSALIVDSITGNVVSISTITIFQTKVIMNFFIGLFIASLCIFIRTLVKNSYLAAFIVFGCVSFVFIVYSLISLIISNYVLLEEINKYMIFINSQVNNLSFNQLSYIIMILAYLFGSILLLRYSKRKLLELDI